MIGRAVLEPYAKTLIVAALSCGLGVSMLNTALLIIFTAAPESIRTVHLVPLIFICV